MGALAWKLPASDEVERRHDKRVEVSLLGRFMRSDRQEFDCEIDRRLSERHRFFL